MPVELQSIQVETNSADREGRLVLCDGMLVGILVRLSAAHGIWTDHWSVEWITELLHHPPPFRDLEAACAWFGGRFEPEPNSGSARPRSTR